jgi:hypothetical protein
MLRLTLTAALLALAACAHNKLPAPTEASHPPALDLTCLPEPKALTDEQVLADEQSDKAGLGRPNDEAFNDGTLIAGRSCRDALRRACQWHRARGDKALKCDTAAMTGRELDALARRLLANEREIST